MQRNVNTFVINRNDIMDSCTCFISSKFRFYFPILLSLTFSLIIYIQFRQHISNSHFLYALKTNSMYVSLHKIFNFIINSF